MLSGGAKGDRTPDLNAASVALSQLSYGPQKDKKNLRAIIGDSASAVNPFAVYFNRMRYSC